MVALAADESPVTVKRTVDPDGDPAERPELLRGPAPVDQLRARDPRGAAHPRPR